MAGLKTTLAIASFIRVVKFGDKVPTNTEIAEILQCAQRVTSSRKELVKLCEEASKVIWHLL